jgi:hypothetical protein
MEELKAAAEANKKKKAPSKKGKKGNDDQKEEVVEEQQVADTELEEAEKQYDLNLPSEFKEALMSKTPRPFIFGPVEFSDLDKAEDQKPFNPEQQR